MEKKKGSHAGVLCHLPLLHLAARGRDIEPRSATRPKSKGLFDDTYLKRDSAAVSALSGHGRTSPREGVTYSIAMTLTALPALEWPEPSPTAAFRGAFLTPTPPGVLFAFRGPFLWQLWAVHCLREAVGRGQLWLLYWTEPKCSVCISCSPPLSPVLQAEIGAQVPTLSRLPSKKKKDKHTQSDT